MQLSLFLKLDVVAIAISLLVFAFSPSAGLLSLAKYIALGIGISIIITLIYPSFRGVQKGDKVIVVSNSAIPSLFGRVGMAMNGGKLQGEIRIKLDDGREIAGVIDSYSGLLSLPKVRVVYEERIIE